MYIISQEVVTNRIFRWKFPAIGVPANHPYIINLNRIFHYKHYKPSSYWGTSMAMEPPLYVRKQTAINFASDGDTARWDQHLPKPPELTVRELCVKGAISPTGDVTWLASREIAVRLPEIAIKIYSTAVCGIYHQLHSGAVKISTMIYFMI